MQLTTAPAELDGFLETEAGQADLFRHTQSGRN